MRTTSVRGGIATVSCTGDAISLVSAHPNDGYKLTIDKSGPEHVELTFTGSRERIELRARCSDGRPRWTVDDDDDDHDGEGSRRGRE
jgi:hypothetical protein